MLKSARKRSVIGIGLIVIGVAFLMVSNNIWLGWTDVWPLFPVLAGILLLRLYTRRRTPETLFGGIASLLMGVFLLLFTAGIFPWSRLGALWPVFPTIAGVGLLAVAVTRYHGTASLTIGAVLILLASLGFLHEGGIINERVFSPFIRLWPLVLVVAGVTLLRTKPAGEDADMKAVRDAMDGGEDPADPSAPLESEPTG
jgi:hypothetical protein